MYIFSHTHKHTHTHTHINNPYDWLAEQRMKDEVGKADPLMHPHAPTTVP